MRTLALIAGSCLLLLPAADLAGQTGFALANDNTGSATAAERAPAAADSAALPLPRTRASRYLGDPAPTRVYVGMWTIHFRDLQSGVDANRLIGVTHRGYYAATFINTFGVRAYSVGVHRAPLAADVGPIRLGGSYRAGVVTGYDERFLDWARHTPVVPVLQIVGTAEIGRAGFELSYAGVVTSLTLSMRL